MNTQHTPGPCIAEANTALIAAALDMKAVLYEALDYEAEAFKDDEPVNGADLIDWFSEWRHRVASALARAEGVKP